MTTKQRKLTMPNVLITGGAGFIGTNFVKHYTSEFPDNRVIILDILSYAGGMDNISDLLLKPDVDFVQGNITDFDLVDGLLKSEEIEIVIHFAAESHVDRSIDGPRPFIDTNVNGTLSLLEACRRNWTEFSRKRFIHISTDEVYGSLGFSDPPFTEKSQYLPNSPYSASKAASDHLVRAYFKTYNLPTVTIHSSNNYGPYQFPEKLIPVMITKIINNKPLPVYGSGENIRDWIYVDDFCSAIVTIIEQAEVGEVYNVGGSHELSNINLVRKICDVMDKELNRVGLESSHHLIQFVSDRLGHDLRYAINTSKIETQLGWHPTTTFTKGLEKTVDWYLKNRSWWENRC